MRYMVTPERSSPEPLRAGMRRDVRVGGPTVMPMRLSASSSPVAASPIIRYQPSSFTLGNLRPWQGGQEVTTGGVKALLSGRACPGEQACIYAQSCWGLESRKGSIERVPTGTAYLDASLCASGMHARYAEVRAGKPWGSARSIVIRSTDSEDTSRHARAAQGHGHLYSTDSAMQVSCTCMQHVSAGGAIGWNDTWAHRRVLGSQQQRSHPGPRTPCPPGAAA